MYRGEGGGTPPNPLIHKGLDNNFLIKNVASFYLLCYTVSNREIKKTNVGAFVSR